MKELINQQRSSSNSFLRKSFKIIIRLIVNWGNFIRLVRTLFNRTFRPRPSLCATSSQVCKYLTLRDVEAKCKRSSRSTIVHRLPRLIFELTSLLTPFFRHSSKSLASKTIFDAECRQSEQNQHHAATADYTFLDPSKKRIISNQNLKVIQKQALISYYERHHSTWRSEPQLSSNLSSVKPHPRPRLPTPTSCHLTSSSDTEESFGVNVSRYLANRT